jgi:hypothetical protein
LKVFASFWSDNLVDVDTTIISNVTSATSVSVGDLFPFDHLVFPVCTRVDQALEITSSELKTATFSNLTFVGNDVSIHSNPFLSAAYFPKLLAFAVDVIIYYILDLMW